VLSSRLWMMAFHKVQHVNGLKGLTAFVRDVLDWGECLAVYLHLIRKNGSLVASHWRWWAGHLTWQYNIW
jgi:hypothetical protein